MAKLATNCYYVGYGSTSPLTVDLDPASYDPNGFSLCVDGEWESAEWIDGDSSRQWSVDTSCMTAGVHTVTVRSETFSDLVDMAMIKVVGVTFLEDGTTKYNFSPSQVENAAVKVAVTPVPPPGGLAGFHFKIEIVRELVASAY